MNAQDIIKKLDLQPHPEGGWYRQTWIADAADGERAAGTAIYYLLEKGQRSHWHRVDADEAWHWYAGAPMRLCYAQGSDFKQFLLNGNPANFEHKQLPQAVVPKGCWQAAKPHISPLDENDWSLVGCTVSPAFHFEGFEMAPPGWMPPVPEPGQINPFDFTPYALPEHVSVSRAALAEIRKPELARLLHSAQKPRVLGVFQSLGSFTHGPDGQRINESGPRIGIGIYEEDQVDAERIWVHEDLRVVFAVNEIDRLSCPFHLNFVDNAFTIERR